MTYPFAYPLASLSVPRSTCISTHLLATVATTVSLSWRSS
jgi:hypothetical protein